MKKKILIVALCALVMLCMSFLASCTDEDAPQATKWYSGAAAPKSELGQDGDFYFNTDTSDVYKRDDGRWEVISNLKGEDGADGEDGTDGRDGKNGKDGKDGKNGLNAVITEEKPYIGYGGYIWNGKNKTDISVNVNDEGVYEDTLGVIGEMQNYYEGSFLDLSGSRIALMAAYKPTVNKTFYSGLSITKITVYTESAGDLYIGTAKLSEIESAVANGVSLIPTASRYSVGKGLATVEFTPPLYVAQDETVVIGGQSVSLYCTKELPVYDEMGNFSYLNAMRGDIISNTNGLADTLAIKVECEREGIHKYESATPTVVDDSNGNIVFDRKASLSGAPYIYYDDSTRKMFSAKKLYKIGVPVVSVGAIDANQTFTVSVVTVGNSSIVVDREVTVKLPIELLGTDASKVNRWIYIDLSAYDIKLGSRQTLAFGKNTDTVVWGYGTPSDSSNSKYRFATVNAINSSATYPKLASEPSNTGIYFDVWYEQSTGTAERADSLDLLERAYIEATERDHAVMALRDELDKKGKNNISIFGDSISTFAGVTNGADAASTTNSTINDGRGAWYGLNDGKVDDVRHTWWRQAAFSSGLDVLVNNSWSGDQLGGTSGKGLTRCDQLHDDTGSNAGTKPDIIAVFFGTNDLGRNVAPETFESLYTQMVDKMQAAYPGADIFLFTLLNCSDLDVTTEELYLYNDIIRNIASAKGCTVVDLQRDSGINASTYYKYTLDGTHPNRLGMDLITDCFVEAMCEKYLG
ncbi:MAG: SGNH/GDSL hydrolase family protein [Clostridia bacterium]|nr:SGNH/GDSL hydrolase family protein [Clostridia bacterium]